MNKIDYNQEMMKEINSLKSKPKLLLHSCCAPCSSSVLERLGKFFDITVFFYNPNIDNNEEYFKRQDEEIRLIEELNKENNGNNLIKIITNPHLSEDYISVVKGLENEKEGGSRCEKCFNLRLSKTAEFAKLNRFEYFTTTLSVSPHKNAQKLNEIGNIVAKQYDIKFLMSDFKKQEGYKRSIELSKKYNLYRQDYCGCKFSKRNNLED